MWVYAMLFALAFANEYVLTSYYVRASLGQRWRCVALSLCQQAVASTALFFTLVDVPPMSREQFIRFAVQACAYGCATAVVVKPQRLVVST